MDWEEIDTFHHRARVFGGWLVKASESVVHDVDGKFDSGWDWRVSMCFVPDPNYEWVINK